MIVIFLLLVIITININNINGYNVRIPLVPSSSLVSSSLVSLSSSSSSLSVVNRKSMKLYAGPPDTKGPGGPKKKKLKDDVVEVDYYYPLPP